MQTVRTLIDADFQITDLTKCCVNCLGLYVKRWISSVTRLAGAPVSPVIGQVKFMLTPRYADSPQLPTAAWVLDKITNMMPMRPMPLNVKDLHSHLARADPNFTELIDMLIGADLYPLIMEGGKEVFNKD